MFTVVFELMLPFLGLGWLLPSWEGTVSRTINMGAMFVLVVFLNLYAADKTRIPRPWSWILLILPALNILLSLTRGLWLGTIIAVGTSAFLLTGRTRWKVLSVFGILACCLLLSAAAVEIGGGSALDVFEERVAWGESQVQKAFTGEESLATRRFMEFVIISPELVTAPFLGRGLGAQYAIGSFAIADPGDVDVIDHHYIHNIFLMVSFRMGIIGLLLFCGILYNYFRMAIKVCVRLPNGSSRALVAGLIASVLGQLALSMTWPTILDHPTAGMTACAVAMTFTICRLEMNEQAVNGARGS
jgi:O-antigen ligase